MGSVQFNEPRNGSCRSRSPGPWSTYDTRGPVGARWLTKIGLPDYGTIVSVRSRRRLICIGA
jgi:hypothetical protein